MDFRGYFLFRLKDNVETAFSNISVDFRDRNTFTDEKVSKLLSPANQNEKDARKAAARLLDFLEGYSVAAFNDPPLNDQDFARSHLIFWYEFFEKLLVQYKETKKEQDSQVYIMTSLS